MDLLIDLTAADLSAPSLLLVEAKAAGGGRSKMIREVLADIKRFHAWSSLEILSRPTFFFWSNAADVRGLLAAIFSEKLIQQSDKTFDRRPDSLAAWWETLQGTPKAAAKLIEELESALRPALWRKVVPGPTKDGGTQLFVALALFQCDLPEPK